jgi:glycosyltransferase involved in cell wall biosynthesis
MDEAVKITTIILTLNEQSNISHCIESVKDLNGDVFVIDSGSTDNTLSIAESLGAVVVYNEFKSHSQQFNWALDTLDIRSEWILKLDADERLTKELSREIIQTIRSQSSLDAYIIKQKIFFMGRFIRHGGAYPFRKLMLFKKGFVRSEDREMDEHLVLLKGKLGELSCDGLHYDFKSLDHYVKKHNWYASKEVNEMIKSNGHSSNFNSDTKIKNKRKLKSFYLKSPLFLRARLYYIYRFYFKLGFLDGTEGKIFHFLQAYFYRFLVDAKYFERINRASDKVDMGPLK